MKERSLDLVNITGRGLHVQNRTQGCIFFSPTKPKIQTVCKFQMEGLILSIFCLCFGLGPAPRIFTRLMRILIYLLRVLYVRLITFLDDILLMASSKEELTLPRETLIHFFQNLGFLINRKNSVLEPCQNIQFWGIEIKSLEMTLTFPQEKKRRLCNSTKLYWGNHQSP